MTLYKTRMALAIGAAVTCLALPPASLAQGEGEGVYPRPYPKQLGVDVAPEAATEERPEGDVEVTNREVVVDEDIAERTEQNAQAIAGDEEAELREQRGKSERTWRDTQSAFQSGWIEGKLETALVLNDQLQDADIKVEVQDNRAILRGAVANEVQKELAEDVARGVEGVEQVQNELSVVGDEALREARQAQSAQRPQRDFLQYFSDVSTTAAIKTRLLAEQDIRGRDINVDTFGNQVTLSGTVQTSEQRDAIESIAEGWRGVERVVNRIEVQS